MASIRRRGRGYQVQVRRIGSSPASRTFTLKAHAERWARQTEIDAENGCVGNHVPESVTLRTLLERYAQHHAPHLKSQKQTLSLVNLMIGRLGHLLVQNIDNPVLAQYRDSRLRVVSSQTVRKEIDIVRRVIRLAGEEWGLRLPRGVPSVRMPRQPSGRSRRITDDELKRLSSFLTPVMQLAVKVAIETAMRRGEIANIKSVDLCSETRSLRIGETKNGKPRSVPVTERTVLALTEHLEAHYGRLGVRPDSITQAFNRAVTKASVQDLRFHDLRHEAITRMFESGLSVPKVSLISGHSDYRMLARYTHLD